MTCRICSAALPPGKRAYCSEPCFRKGKRESDKRWKAKPENAKRMREWATKYKRQRYRHDPEFRAAVLAQNNARRHRYDTPHHRRIRRLTARIHTLRNSLEFHMNYIAKQEKRLLKAVEERERLKAS